MSKDLEQLAKEFPSFDSLKEDKGAFEHAKDGYEKAILLERDYEIDVLRDLQRAVNRCRNNSPISMELNRLDKNYQPKIVSRVKSLDSIYRKIVKGEIKWDDLPLDDIIGYRLVCRFLDEAIELRDLLDYELDKPPFNIISRFPRLDSKNWAEKESYSGYRSYDFAFRYQRPELGIQLEGELQVRTILQHAWAEVSHDTFYKNDSLALFPKEISEGLILQMHNLSDSLYAIDKNFVQLRKQAIAK